MSTQYNAIQGPYDELRKKTIPIVERVNVRSLVTLFIQDATVLDLACGTGFYSRHFVKWGPCKVVGVDISSAMIEQARAMNASDDAEFIEANCDTPTIFPGGPFDVIFGAWYLNYAATGSAMLEMFRNVLLNLKPGGRLVADTQPPANDPVEYIRRECEQRPLPIASGGLYTTINKEVADGVYDHYHSATPAGDLDFDTSFAEGCLGGSCARSRVSRSFTNRFNGA
ncbi:hypothetical protein M409DRAFT_59687 [Zasmidium cellare ATCC 36951]|uniref:Methyltransferase domain-containing protein n=1 Tax=Zasmidium cellare ATCC 36951 TaxID=1080233 RepID=A0A6A6C1H2_ZASCE|nr:uncharacterized protein M409DRAFT_59687 [Zasmidium cellare ATCC 36951]KAF2160907.1 hypothetical protein M409DRAFT_59687 [Zasmidium cellare ATCC 36951]